MKSPIVADAAPSPSDWKDYALRPIAAQTDTSGDLYDTRHFANGYPSSKIQPQESFLFFVFFC